MRLILTISFAILFGSPEGFAAAAESEDERNPIVSKETAIEQDNYVSEKIESWMDSVDVYLAGKRISSRPNESAINLQFLAKHLESRAETFDPRVDFDLDLPNLQEHWKILFSNYDRYREEIDREFSVDGQAEVETENYTGFAFFQSLGNFDVTFQPQIQLSDRLETKYVIDGDSEAEITEDSRLRIKLQLFARSDQGVGEFTSFYFRQNITSLWSWSTGFRQEYSDFENNWRVGKSASLTRRLERRMSLTTGFVMNSDNQPAYSLKNYGPNITFSHIPVEEVFRYHLTTYLTFQKGESFEGKSGVTLSLEYLM